MTKIRTLSRAAAAALLIAALAVPAYAASNDIGIEKAKEIALAHAGVAESETVFLFAEPDYDDGRLEYEVEFYAGQTEYDYTIDAKSGQVMKFDTDLEWYSPESGAGYNWSGTIDAEKAKEIALTHAGVSAADTVYLSAKPDYDDGVKVFDVEFYTNGTEYDYEINAETGAVLSFDHELEWRGTKAASSSANTSSATVTKPAAASSSASSASAASSSSDIGADKAKSIALAHAGLSEGSVDFLYAETDWENGRRVYDVEFYADGREYDYEILAADGTILGYDYDAEREWNLPAASSSASSSSGSTSASGSSYIGTEKAKSIVTSRAGVSETFWELKLDWDDGRAVYEGEMRSGRTEYEFEIDAVSGTILDWDMDRD